MEPDLSVVLPFHNEAQSLPILEQELQAALAALGRSWEAIYVDDGSTDDSAAVVRALAGRDPRVRLVRLARHSGLTAAFRAGFGAARGCIIVTLDTDLQFDPAEIATLLEPLDRYDAAVGWRRTRRDPWLKRVSSRLANGLRILVTGDPVRDSACSFRAMHRYCVDAIPPYAGMHRFVPTLLKLAGYRVVEVPVRHRPRRFGRSKYGIRNRTLTPLVDLLVVRWMLARRLPPAPVEDVVGPREQAAAGLAPRPAVSPTPGAGPAGRPGTGPR